MQHKLTHLLPALIAAVAVWISTSGGLFVGPDGAHYLYAGSALARGDGFLNAPGVGWVGVEYTERAPLYPLVLAVFEIIGLEVETAVRLLNAACYALTVLLIVKHSRYKLALSIVLLNPFVMVPFVAYWSEPLFIVLTVSFALTLVRPGRQQLLAASVLAALALLDRYSGAALVAFGFVYFLWRRGLRDALLFLVLPITAIAPWMIFNYQRVGSLLGYRNPAIHPWWDNVRIAAAITIAWLIWVGAVVWIGEAIKSWRGKLS